jgi:hypothetical protein
MVQMNDAFQEGIKPLSETLKQLLSVAKILHGCHADALSDHVRDLAECFLKQFCYITTAVNDWRIYVKYSPSTPLSPGFVAKITSIMRRVLSRNANMLCEKITLLASTETSKWKSRAATGKRRKEEEGLGANDPSNELPLATSTQVLEVLEKLLEAISKTFQFLLEFGLGLYWNSQLQVNTTTLAGTADVNPFMVDEEVNSNCEDGKHAAIYPSIQRAQMVSILVAMRYTQLLLLFLSCTSMLLHFTY